MGRSPRGVNHDAMSAATTSPSPWSAAVPPPRRRASAALVVTTRSVDDDPPRDVDELVDITELLSKLCENRVLVDAGVAIRVTT